MRYGYDAARRLTLIEYPAIKRSLRYEYDGAGALTAFTDSEGRRYGYDYDAYGRITAIRLQDGGAISFAYDASDRMIGIEYPNGVTGAWEVDARGLPTAITYTGPAGATLAGWRYAYDAADNPTLVTDAQSRASSYRYDAAGRLVEEGGPGGATRFTIWPAATADRWRAPPAPSSIATSQPTGWLRQAPRRSGTTPWATSWSGAALGASRASSTMPRTAWSKSSNRTAARPASATRRLASASGARLPSA